MFVRSMELFFVVVCLVVMVTDGKPALHLPSFIKPCSRNDPNLNECALARGKSVIHQFKDGLPKYRIPRLEPLLISEIKVNQEKGASSGVGIDLVAKDILVHGISDSKLKNISIQLHPPQFYCTFFMPRIELEAKYLVDGNILILPIKGDGHANITLVNLDIIYNFDGEWTKKSDGKEYMDIKNSHFDFKSDRTYIKLTNLFNGDKELGKRMNEFLDANWREVTEEMGPPIADAIGQVIKNIVEGMTDQVPYEYLFPEKA